ncbi:MAG: Slp family lipoprotein [Desulfobacterales bacterium]|nr:Slp family lipoprotein [Pseudomonadota bacterium]MCG2777490.1 Slp family lipoprotein [Desulfobacterales bacterium]
MRCKQDWRKSGQMIASLLLLLLIYSSLTACAPALSKQFREKALPPVSFNELLSDPNTHRGRNVILGGYILEVKNESDGSRLTILQAPLDFQNRPHSRDKSKGRFLARTDKFIDPEIYKKERKLTVGGIVAGVSAQPLGDRIYRYPVIEVEELYLWAEETRQDWPYDPYYDPYWDHWGFPWYPYHRSIRPYHR